MLSAPILSLSLSLRQWLILTRLLKLSRSRHSLMSCLTSNTSRLLKRRVRDSSRLSSKWSNLWTRPRSKARLLWKRMQKGLREEDESRHRWVMKRLRKTKQKTLLPFKNKLLYRLWDIFMKRSRECMYSTQARFKESQCNTFSQLVLRWTPWLTIFPVSSRKPTVNTSESS